MQKNQAECRGVQEVSITAHQREDKFELHEDYFFSLM